MAVILNGFTNSSEEEGFEVFKNNIEIFKKLWKNYDTEATGFIAVEDIGNLINDLEKETEFITTAINNDPKLLRSFIANMQVPCYGKFTKYFF